MLFNSYPFLLGFLPVVLAGYLALVWARADRASKIWLAVASLFFYAWWRPSNIAVIGVSLAFNYGLGITLQRRRARWRPAWRRTVLTVGIAGNLALLGYFKYFNFVVDQVAALTGLDFVVRAIVLPIGISFFTFQQIAFLVDASEGDAEEHDFIDYVLFVTFFPQLIAGPIVHHREMMGQFAENPRRRLSAESAAKGVTFFTFGLMKKVLIADSLAKLASPSFAAVADGAAISATAAWTSVTAYTLQLYFDFSAYSDMAIGLGLLFGIRLPYNFNSPYRAVSMIDFWRRWHITLSRFLRDYVYIPLGGNRRGPVRRYVNLFTTMVLGGIWHGAGWTFVVWGALHGLYLIANHGWNALLGRRDGDPMPWWEARIGQGITLFLVMIAWVFFRAVDMNAAFAMLGAMAGQNGLGAPGDGFNGVGEAAFLLFFFAVAVAAPNTQDMIDGAGGRGWANVLRWRPSLPWAAAMSVGLLYAMTQMSRVSEFLYFQF